MAWVLFFVVQWASAGFLLISLFGLAGIVNGKIPKESIVGVALMFFVSLVLLTAIHQSGWGV